MSSVLPCDAVDTHFPAPPAQSGFDNTNVLRNAHLTAVRKSPPFPLPPPLTLHTGRQDEPDQGQENRDDDLRHGV